MAAEIHVNGTARPLHQPGSVADLLAELGFAATPCAVEVNGRVVPRRSHADRLLAEGDVIEIVTLVGGG